MAMQIMEKNGREMVAFSGVRIINRNFSGLAKEYNKSGARGFCVLLTQEEADELSARGYNVRIRPAKEDPNAFFCHLQVAVRFDFLPPKIYRVLPDKMMLLNENNVGVLDTSDIINVDLVVNARHWNINGASGIKCYVNSMYVQVEEDLFASKYADLEVVS